MVRLIGLTKKQEWRTDYIQHMKEYEEHEWYKVHKWIWRFKGLDKAGEYCAADKLSVSVKKGFFCDQIPSR